MFKVGRGVLRGHPLFVRSEWRSRRKALSCLPFSSGTCARNSGQVRTLNGPLKLTFRTPLCYSNCLQ